MSEFLAEARILVRPDTTRFRAELQSQLIAATRGVQATVPVNVAVAGAGLAAAASSTAALQAAQTAAQQSTLGLASAAQVENTAFGRQAVILTAASAATTELAGAQAVAARSARTSTAQLLGAGSATAKLDAALLGLRTAIGSAAVIGLGALSLGAIAAGAALRSLLTSTANFERELSTFRAVTEATADQMNAVSEAAVRLGADVRLPAVSAGDAAVAMTELARAGLSVEDAMAGAEGVLQLATAAQLDNAEAAQIAANALNAFGLAGDQATRVADTFANAANAAQGSIADIGIAFRQAATVSRQVGLSLEDTTAILALFARNGLQASDAGTSLRTALIRLVAPGDAAAKKIDELGINIRDAQGNLRADVFAQFGQATENLAPAARDAAAALIFGQDAIRAVAIGAREGTDGLRLMQFEIDQTGTAAEVAGARTEGLDGAMAGLKSNAETLGITFGGLVSGPIQAYVNLISDVLSVTNRATTEVTDFASSVANIDTPFGKLSDRLLDVATVLNGNVRLYRAARFGLDQLGIGTDEAAEKAKALNDQLQALQTARIEAERGGQRGVADDLTVQIKAVREEINALKRDGADIPTSLTANLEEAVEQLERVQAIRVDLDIDTTDVDRLLESLKAQIPITQQVEGNINRLRDDFLALGSAGREGGSGVDVLAEAMRNLQRQSSVLSDALLRLRTEGGSPQQQIGVLQRDIQVQRDIIATAQEGGIQAGEPTIIRQAREEIIRLQGEIDSLRSEIESAEKKVVADAEKAARELQDARDKTDRAFLDVLSRRRDTADFAAAQARLTPTLRDDIQAQNVIQAQLRNQIRLIREQVQGEEAKQEAIRQLQNALRDSQLLERQLRQQQRQAAEEAKAAREEQRRRALELNLEFAEITGNEGAQERALQAIIGALEKQIAGMKGISNKERELRNELARRRKQLDELRGEQQENNRSAEQFFFEQLQAQQGFAANLLGNLITGPTGGLVGQAAPVTSGQTIQARITAEAAAAKGRAGGGPTSGQVNSTNELLLRILNQLKVLTGTTEAPEAIEQRRTTGAGLDYAVM